MLTATSDSTTTGRVATKSSSLQSLVTFRNSQGEPARGTLLKLDRSSVVFEVYNPYSIVQLSEVLQELTIRRGERVIYQGRAVVSNLVNTGLMLIASATLVDQWPDKPRFSSGLTEFKRETEDFVAHWSDTQQIRRGYRVAVGEICSFLVDLNQWLEQIDANNMDSKPEYFGSYSALMEFSAPILKKLNLLALNFEDEASVVGEAETGNHKAFFQKQVHPLVMRAPFPYRTYHKPLGYAGDYEMMNMIHREEPEGPNTYSRIVNAMYVYLPIATCVRNRARDIEERLHSGAQTQAERGEVFSVISIGCGPATEVERFIRNSTVSHAAHFDLVDFNAETLAYVSRKLEAVGKETGHVANFSIIHESVHFLLKSALLFSEQSQLKSYHFIYCAGLFDYLSDKVCSRLMRLFWSWLNPGGTLLVTNMHIGNPHRYILEHGAEWYLIYRDEAQLMALLPDVGEQRTYTDSSGINLCLEVRKIDRRTN